MSETVDQRKRRKFIAGALDQLGAAMSAYSAGVFTGGVVAPLVASLLELATATLLEVAPLIATAFAVALGLLGLGIRFKARSKQLDDDALDMMVRASRSVPPYVEGEETDNA